MRWFSDSDFLRGKVPMTKYELRVLICSLLGVGPGKTLLDIGSGTGSITCQWAEMGADVWAIESQRDAYDLTLENLERLGLTAQVIHGMAPQDLPRLAMDGCFLGGSRGQMAEIFPYLEENLRPRGIFCGAFITLKNLEICRRELQKWGYEQMETRLIQVSMENEIGLMIAQNPIFLVRGVKRG
ncbi:MAG: precorrin-6Y C5,15-methyltransferase (decarboxylating) subunit CbiT [Tissierellia bacterium]|nr:precorrin-6Y C5,15-methyltransferase (decarboxylating) subunit CbiT [Tissierellia bacterium]